MDMWPEVIKTIERLRLSRERALSVEYFNRILGVSLKKAKEGPSFTTWHGQLPPDGPFSDVLLKMASDGRFAILILNIQQSVTLLRSEEAIAPLGRMSFDQIVPETLPEGAYQRTYQLKGAEITLSYTAKSQRLLKVIMTLREK